MSSQFEHFIEIAVATSTQPSALLQGLHTWCDLGLIADEQVSIRTVAQAESAQPNSLRVELTLQANEADLLASLDTWLQMGLLSQSQLRVEIRVKATAPNLLVGLDSWLQLNLLSHYEILRLCRTHLTCERPLVIPQVISMQQPVTPVGQPSAATPPRLAERLQQRVTQPVTQPVARLSPPPRQKPPNRVGQMLQSLVAELSVVWLLLLGVFMVVISSGVLAASQWERFPAFMQYGILWLYTLGFWGASFWAGRRPTLYLTTQALQIITLLLVPLNFLAMDSFRLWHNPLQWLMMAIATVSLTGVTIQLLRGRSPQPVAQTSLALLNYLGLSYLHLGWAIGGVPLLATYCGVVGTTLLSRFFWSPPVAATPILASRASPGVALSLHRVVVTCAIGLLLLRAIFIAQVEVAQLGLAMGLCAWLLAQRAYQTDGAAVRSATNPQVWQKLGGGLLGLGWLVSVGSVPWQALIVSGLAVLVMAQRLLHTWARTDLAAMLLIGGQMCWLGWRVVPPAAQQGAIAWATELTDTQANPAALLGLALFPYLVVMLLLFDGFMQMRRRQLALFDGTLALAFGAALMVLSWASPVLRALNFGLSTLAMGVITRRQQGRNLGIARERHLPETTVRSLAMLAHLWGLITLGCAIDWAQPRLGLVAWVGIGLGLVILEWLLSLGQPLSPDPETPPTTLFALLRQSSWGFGLILAVLTYGGLLLNLTLSTFLAIPDSLASPNPVSLGGHAVSSPVWGGLWLIIPLTLTGLMAQVRTRRQLAAWLSIAALGLAQTLTLGVPDVRSLSLAIATGLMLVNARYLQAFGPAIIAVGFGLGFVGSILGQMLPGLSLANWLLIGAIATLALWLMRHGLTSRSTRLATLYQQALDGWAIALCGVDLCALGLTPLLSSQPVQETAPLLSILAALLLMGAAAYRSWQPPRQSSFHWLSVGVILIAQVPLLAMPEQRLLSLGVASGLMVLQTRLLQHWIAAALTVGLGLGFANALLWMGLPAPLRGTLPSWLLGQAIAATGLWIWRHWLSQRTTQLAGLYAKAADGWAVTLCGLDLWMLIVDRGLRPTFYFDWELGTPLLITATLILLMLASAYRSWQLPRSVKAMWASVGVLLVAQSPMALLPGARLLLLGVATALMLVHTHYLEMVAAAAITVGLGIGVLGLCLWDGVGAWSVQTMGGWLLAMTLTLLGLWLFRSVLLRRATPLAGVYSQALDRWAIGLGSLALAALTGDSLLVYWQVIPASPAAVGATAITLGAIAYRTWRHPTNWTIYALGWSLELLTLEVLGLTGRSMIALTIANTLLGLLTQVIGDWWHRRTHQPHMLSCWHVMPLIYGALGSALRWNLLTNWTGFSSLGLVLIAIGVGRRQAIFKPLLYLAVAGISLSAYELLFYQIRGLAAGDQLLAMAALATSIVYAYRVLTPWLTGYLRLTRAELTVISHLHWGLGSLLLVSALLFPVAMNKLVGLGAGVFLTRYAIMQGRNHADRIVGEIWVYLGIVEAIGMALYTTLTLPTLSNLAMLVKPWSGAIAAFAAAAVYLLPWRQWGWSNRPWQWAAILAPLGTLATRFPSNNLSVLIVAGFYGWLAWNRQQVRWLYGSLLLIDWAIAQALSIHSWDRPFALACLVGFSLLSITWFEPACQSADGRSLRHALRLLGTGLIGGSALAIYFQPGIIPGIVGIMGIFLGLSLRIRAFLYTGTLTFLAIAFYQLVILIFTYSMLKWVIGLLMGILFIWIAASFETRRNQFTLILQNWLTEFAAWQ